MFPTLCFLVLGAVSARDAPLSVDNEIPAYLPDQAARAGREKGDGAPAAAARPAHDVRTAKARSARAPLRPTSSHASTAERPARSRPRGPTGCLIHSPDVEVPGNLDQADDERDWGLGAEFAISSRFLWRGQYYGHGPVLQPSVWTSYRGFELTLWGNIQAMPRGERGLSVLAPAVSYTYAFDWGSLGAGGALYLETLAREQPPTAGEGYVTASLAYAIVSLRTTQYLHYLGQPGAYYAEAGPAVSWEDTLWSLEASLDLAWASAKYNGFYFGHAEGGFNLLTVQASVARALGSVAYVQLQGEMSRLLSDFLYARRPAWVASGGLSLGLDF